MVDSFTAAVEKKIKKQVNSVAVGFLLGAGSSYLEGRGYPLTALLWDKISASLPPKVRQEIQEKFDTGATGLENALDLLDTGGTDEGPHRHNVVAAIASHFCSIEAPLDSHCLFVSLLARRKEATPIRVFSLNYDPLIERASENERIRLFDGFHGHDNAFFDAESFQHRVVIKSKNYRGRQARNVRGSIRLLKLHGSIGWCQDDVAGIRRRKFNDPLPETSQRLMVPPQYRKAQVTAGQAPYSQLWSEFRGSLLHGDDKLNRLITLGYGMADEHVNAEIRSALARDNFTLIIIAKELSNAVFADWSNNQRVHIVTESRCSLSRRLGEGHPDLCSFEGFVERWNAW